MANRPFLGNAVNYNKYRPDYPTGIYQAIVQFWNHDQAPIILDVGCGTGIAARGLYNAFQQNGKVLGIDPNIDMLQQAKQATFNNQNFEYLEAKAEQLPVSDNSIDIITVAQAMQYINRALLYNEAKRVLRSDGVLAIIENNRNWMKSYFLDEYENFLELYSYTKNRDKYMRDYKILPFFEELAIYFKQRKEETIYWLQKMKVEDFLAMTKATTSVQTAMLNIGEPLVDEHILKLAKSYLNKEGLLEIPYIAKVYMGKG